MLLEIPHFVKVAITNATLHFRVLAVRKRLYGSIANCQPSNCCTLLVPWKNFLFRRTFGPAVFTGQLSSCPLVGRRMGWKSISVLVKQGGQRGGGWGHSCKTENILKKPSLPFWRGKSILQRDVLSWCKLS